MPAQALLDFDSEILMTLAIQHNPFSIRFTRPGQLPFQLRGSEDLKMLVDHFQDHRFLSQIVGPHGSGKTTLTYALEPLLHKKFCTVRRLAIRHPSQIQSDDTELPNLDGANNRLLIIDGIERLPWLHRRLLMTFVRRKQIGLLITTHRPIAGVPVLYETSPRIETLQHLSQKLAPGIAIEKNLLANAFEKNDGNIRESLMSLYDWFETQGSSGCQTT